MKQMVDHVPGAHAPLNQYCETIKGMHHIQDYETAPFVLSYFVGAEGVAY
jgi:hypothetical protein